MTKHEEFERWWGENWYKTMSAKEMTRLAYDFGRLSRQKQDAELCREMQRTEPECPETAEYCAAKIEGTP